MTYQAPGVYIEEAPFVAPIAGVGTSTPAFIGIWADPAAATVATGFADAGTIVLCTNFTEFADRFGGFSRDADAQNRFAHAVRGFFINGGTSCYVVRVANDGDALKGVLEKLEAYDDISMIVAPGVTSKTATGALVAHCKLLADRIAILDTPDVAKLDDIRNYLPGASGAPDADDFAALYTPWLMVRDSLRELNIAVPPSGHVAGIYARTDATRGVHKAPANEVVLGVLGPSIPIGRSQQEKINLQGANCIRMMNGALRVWGARTLAGDSGTRAHFKYVPIRRLMSFLYKSIDHGTQWAVFEPNGPDLWAKIIRNVGSFLTGIWAQGALAGTTPQEAFYVKCDAENNPPDQRANGRLVVEVGVAVLYPAEFVVFKIQHQSSLAK